MQITFVGLTVLFSFICSLFGILESYAMKRFTCLTGMKLSKVVCSCAMPLAQFDWV